jgi:subtilisin family serine protease
MVSLLRRTGSVCRPAVWLAAALSLVSADFRAPGDIVIGISSAHADDDDDDDDDGGGDRRSGRSGGQSGGRSGDRSFSPSRNTFNPIDFFMKRFGKQRVRKARQQRRARSAPPIYQPDEIVALGLSAGQIGALTAQGYQIRQRLNLDSFQGELVKLDPPPGVGLDAARANIRLLAPSAFVDYNHFYRPEEGTNCGGKPCVAPGLVGWPGVSSYSDSCGGRGVTIGLIDTAINPDHETFRSSRLVVLRLDTEGADTSGRQHGTAVASLLVGTGAKGTPGLLPEAELIAVDAFRRNNRADVYDLARSVDMLVDRDVSVINLSLSGPDNAVLKRAVELAAEKDIGLVAAAGNDGPGAKAAYPAAYTPVIAVTAVDRSKRPYRRANRGDYIDLAAPGVGVWAAASIEGARTKTGTSFAAPFVTAAFALAKAKGLAIAEAEAALVGDAEDLGEPGRDPVFGWGLLNARNLCQAGRAASE